jgi:hypothetical protein
MLMETAKWSQRALAGSSRRADDFELERVGYAEPLEEGDAGWLMGPYTREEVTKLLGRFWVVARRFGIRQGTRKTAGFEERLLAPRQALNSELGHGHRGE